MLTCGVFANDEAGLKLVVSASRRAEAAPVRYWQVRAGEVSAPRERIHALDVPVIPADNFTADGPFADPEKAARKLLEIA